MYMPNKDFICEASSEEELLMYNQEKKITIVLNRAALILYNCCINHDMDTALEAYQKKMMEDLKDDCAPESIVDDAKCILDDFLKTEILLEQ